MKELTTKEKQRIWKMNVSDKLLQLQDMVDKGLIEMVMINDIKHYQLTKKGKEVAEQLES